MMVVEEMNEVLKDFTSRLENMHIAYMLTGSVAMMHYITPRMTADIDVVVQIQSENADKIIQNLEPDYYIPHGSMRLAIQRNSMFNILHEKTLVKIDCVLKKTTPFQLKAFGRRKKVNFTNFELWIITPEDLILSKLNWSKDTKSEMQLRDVENLLRSKVDLDYIKSWAERIEVSETLKNILENF